MIDTICEKIIEILLEIDTERYSDYNKESYFNVDSFDLVVLFVKLEETYDIIIIDDILVDINQKTVSMFAKEISRIIESGNT